MFQIQEQREQSQRWRGAGSFHATLEQKRKINDEEQHGGKYGVKPKEIHTKSIIFKELH